MRFSKAIAVLGVVLLPLACADDASGPLAPDAATRAAPPPASVTYQRVLTREQVAARELALRTLSTVPGSVLGPTQVTALVSANDVCGIEVHPASFTLDYTGGAYPKTIQLSLWIWSCSGYNNGYLAPQYALWQSSNPGVATVSSGYVTAVGQSGGSVGICAYLSGYQNCAGGQILGVPIPTRVEVTPSSVSTRVGWSPTQLEAQLYDQYGYALAGATYSWSSSNPGVASVSGSGLVTPNSPGSATVTSCAAGKCGSSAISVDYAILGVSMDGPRIVWLSSGYAEALYTANPYGGSGGYTYQWSITRGNGSSYSLDTGRSQGVLWDCSDAGTGASITVVVTTSTGQTTQMTKPVQVNADATCGSF